MFRGGFCSMSALSNDGSVIRIRWTEEVGFDVIVTADQNIPQNPYA